MKFQFFDVIGASISKVLGVRFSIVRNCGFTACRIENIVAPFNSGCRGAIGEG